MNRFITRLAARWLNRAARDRRADQCEAVKAKARAMRAALGLPEHPALSTKGN